MKSHLLVSQQVPEFVRANHPAFVEFLKVYYQWLEEEYGIGKLNEIVDIDQTVEGFLKYFRKELDVYGTTLGQQNRSYLKNAKQLYAMKGSAQGIQRFLRIAYGKESTVQSPWDTVFKASAGRWKQDVSVLCRITTGDPATLVGNPVILTERDGTTHRVFVINQTTRRNGVVELFISRFFTRSPLVTIETPTGDVQGTIYPTTVKYLVDKVGGGFSVGQVFAVNSAGGSGTLVKVKAVDADGGIKALDFISYGHNYLTDFNILITPSGSVDLALQSRINLVNTGAVVSNFNYLSDDNVNPQNEQGLIVQHDYTNLDNQYMVDPTYVGKVAAEIRSQDVAYTPTDNYASIRFNVGYQCVYPGYYEASDNILGDSTYIQDSYYYQAFSYVTSLDEDLHHYSSELRRLLHPAGTMHFGNYQITDTFQLSTRVDPTLNLISRADALRDFIIPTDLASMDVGLNATGDTATVTDILARVASYFRTFNETVNPTDAIRLNIQPRFADVATATDSTSTVFNAQRSFAHTAVATDSGPTFEGTKSLATTFLATDVFNRTAVFARGLTDAATATDNNISITARPAFGDTVSTSDVIDIIPGIALNDSVAITESVSINADKYLSTIVQTSNSGALFVEPYYYETQPDQYWQAGYLENEREITN